MFDEAFKKRLLEFFSLPEDEQLRFLSDTNIAQIRIKKYKESGYLRAKKRASRLRASADSLHADYDRLMSLFEIDSKKGTVRIKNSARRPGRTKQGYLLYMVKGRPYLC